MIPHIHTCIVSYNRLDLLRRCYKSYIDTVQRPYSLVIVDNGSDDDVVRWLVETVAPYHHIILLPRNMYPGYACNRGWEMMPDETAYLHRSDNDFIFLDGWQQEVLERFRRPCTGQVGLRTAEEEQHARYNVGGNNVIRRRLWDIGLRYDERPWPEFPTGYTEDSFFSPEVTRLGYVWTRVTKPCVQPISREDPDDDYYKQTWADRGINQ